MSVLQMARSGYRRLTPFAAMALAALAGACNGDSTGVSQSAIPADSTLATADTTAPAAPGDSTLGSQPGDSVVGAPADSSIADSTAESGSTPILETNASMAGIVFGTNSLDASLIGSVHSGTLRGGGVTEKSIGTLLASVKARGGRIVVKLCNGSDSYVKNGDGTFSLTKWKALVARFKGSNLGPYINDGTIVGHYLIDEPQRAQRWGGKPISAATLEEMAKYSKSIWPTMATFVRAVPTELAKSTITYRYLDAGWAQYVSNKGNVNTYIANEVAAAKKKGLGLMVGLNVLDGGNGSSRLAGYTRGKYKMSASEIRTYATALLGQSYVCGFYNWMYDAGYYGRSDIKSAFADISAKARAHMKTSCKQ